jgi:hypothetical protein
MHFLVEFSHGSHARINHAYESEDGLQNFNHELYILPKFRRQDKIMYQLRS